MRTVTKGKKYKCLECTGYEQSLTIGKDYTALENDEGIAQLEMYLSPHKVTTVSYSQRIFTDLKR